jgi:S1-C subfamily serine protease
MSKRIGTLIVVILFAVGCVFAQQPQSSGVQQPLSAAAQVKQTVAFLRVEYLKDGKRWQEKGTGFFVVYPDKRLGENGGFMYLVTNRHVAQPEIEKGQAYPVQRTQIRMNLRNPGQGEQSEESTLPLGGALHWYFSTDEAIDLAVLPMLPNADKYDYFGFPVTAFATSDVVKSRNVGEGDNVLFTGFFYQFPGLKKIEPIVREGILSMMPDEQMQTTLHKPGFLYLADVHVFGGNSGAPLFVNVGGYRNGIMTMGGFPYLLLGVISGYYHEETDLTLTVATTVTGTVGGNSGIATVVPADQLKTLLDSPDLQALRDQEVSRMTPKK